MNFPQTIKGSPATESGESVNLSSLTVTLLSSEVRLKQLDGKSSLCCTVSSAKYFVKTQGQKVTATAKFSRVCGRRALVVHAVVLCLLCTVKMLLCQLILCHFSTLPTERSQSVQACMHTFGRFYLCVWAGTRPRHI